MATPAQIKAHDELISTQLADANDAIVDATKAVENQLAETILGFQDPSQLVNERARLDQAFEPLTQYAQTMPERTQALSADSIQLQGLGERDAQDTVSENALAQVSQREIETVVQEQRTSIVDNLVVAAVAGTALTQIAQTARYSVSGLQAESSDPGVRRLQRQMRQLQADGADSATIAGVVQQLRSAIGDAIPKTANVAETLKRRTQDTVMRFESAFTAGRSRRKGVKRWRYEGGVIDTSRDFCVSLEGSELTEEEIQSIWADQWAGKEPGDPFVVRGGYNCRHFWVPVEE